MRRSSRPRRRSSASSAAPLLGLLLAIATAEWATARRGLYPLLVTTQAIPPIALATPLAIWLGYGLAPKVIVVSLLVFFPVFVNAHAGLTQLEPGSRATASLARRVAHADPARGAAALRRSRSCWRRCGSAPRMP